MPAEEQPTRRRPVLGQQLVCQRVLRWWPLLHVIRVRFRLLRMRLFEWKVSHMPVKPLPQRRLQMLAEKQPTRGRLVLGQRLVRQRILRRRTLLQVNRVRLRVLGMRCFDWQVYHLRRGFPLRNRRLQVLAKEIYRYLLLGRRRVFQLFLRGKPLLLVQRVCLRLLDV